MHVVYELISYSNSFLCQDMLDPEFYLEKYAVDSGDSLRIQNGKLRDAFLLKNDENVDLENSQNLHGERRSIFVVTIPGLNNWAVDVERDVHKVKSDTEGDNTQQMMVSSMKRPLEDTEDQKLNYSSPNNKMIAAESNGTTQGSSNNLVLSREYLLNSPIRDRPSKACLVKVCIVFPTLKLKHQDCSILSI